MTRHKRGKYALAIEDFERACADDPDNLALRKLLKQACDKFEEVRSRRPLYFSRAPPTRPADAERRGDGVRRRRVSRSTRRESRVTAMAPELHRTLRPHAIAAAMARPHTHR